MWWWGSNTGLPTKQVVDTMWWKIVFLIYILEVYNTTIIYNRKKKKELREELETALLKIPTN